MSLPHIQMDQGIPAKLTAHQKPTTDAALNCQIVPGIPAKLHVKTHSPRNTGEAKLAKRQRDKWHCIETDPYCAKARQPYVHASRRLAFVVFGMGLMA